MARFYFKTPVRCRHNSRSARFRGGRLQRSTRTRVHSFNSCMDIKCPCAYGNCCYHAARFWGCRLLGRVDRYVWRRLKGVQGAARFRGNTVSPCFTRQCSVVDLQKQDCEVDCGVFAIATATSLAHGEHLATFDQSARKHLLDCFTLDNISTHVNTSIMNRHFNHLSSSLSTYRYSWNKKHTISLLLLAYDSNPSNY